MSDAREKAVERVPRTAYSDDELARDPRERAVRQLATVLAHCDTPPGHLSPYGSAVDAARSGDTTASGNYRAIARDVIDALGLVAVDPALVEAVEKAAPAKGRCERDYYPCTCGLCSAQTALTEAVRAQVSAK